MQTLAIGLMKMSGQDQKYYYAFNTSAPASHRYRVNGTTVEEQTQTLQRMGNAMVSDPAGFPSSIDEFMDLNDIAVDEAYNELFAVTSSEMLNSAVIYTVPAVEEGEVLAGFLAEVGGALIEFV